MLPEQSQPFKRGSSGERIITPKGGDLYETEDGRYFLVDFVEALLVGITLCSGVRLCFDKREHFREYVESVKGRTISVWEEGRWKHVDYIGWIADVKKPVDKEISASYIAEQVVRIKKQKALDTASVLC